jgi:hypothetical protein
MSRFSDLHNGIDGVPGPTGPKGDIGLTGTQGPKGDQGDTPNLSSYAGDILPASDNAYVLGNSDYRWKSISIGEGTIYITDAITGNEAALSISDGVFFIDGIAQAQLPDLAVTNLIFNDNTVQTTAFIPSMISGSLKFVSSIPAHDYGVAGDKKNTFSYDNTHFYVCIADYVNDSTKIWKRINWAGGNW